MDLTSAARKLRIRPDILRAIETADFARMPPRGYTRNMIGAYARLVGLNQLELTNMYLDELYAHEAGMPRNAESRERAQRSGRAPSRERSSRRSESTSDRSSRRGERSHANASGPSRGFSVSRPQGRQRNADRGQSAPARGAYPSLYSQQKRRGGSGVQLPGLPFIVGAIVIVIVLVVVMTFAFGGSKQQEADVPNVPISGLTDTSNPESEAAVEQVQIAPTSAVFTFEVSDGSQSWCEVYRDSSATPELAEAVSGPATKEFTVTDTLEFRTANSSPVTARVDGEVVQLEADANTGYYTYTVNFSEILEKWNEEHPKTSSSSSSSSASSASSSSSRSSSAAA